MINNLIFINKRNQNDCFPRSCFSIQINFKIKGIVKLQLLYFKELVIRLGQKFLDTGRRHDAHKLLIRGVMSVNVVPFIKVRYYVCLQEILNVYDVGNHGRVVVVIVESPVLTSFVVIGKDPLKSIKIAS